MSFNIYKDVEEQFIYIEKNNNWYMTLYEIPDVGDIHVIPIPKIGNTEELIKENIKEYDCFEGHEITKCSKCENKGYFYDDWSLEYEICDCYHGQRTGFKALEAHLDDNQEYY